jgi:hypothetical protein
MRRIYISLLLLCFGLPGFSQEEAATRNYALRIFFDCVYCDTDFIKKEITFVNYVRDRNDAQVHIMTTNEGTGSGGMKITFFFIGQKEFTAQADTLTFFTQADATHDEIRTKQVQYLKMGLVRYVAKTPYADKILIQFGEETQAAITADKWNSWYYEIDGSAFFQGEQSSKFLNSYSSIEAQRITEDLKVEFRISYTYNQRDFSYNDTTVTSTTNNKNFHHLLVKSINNHWSYGYNLRLGSSLFQNYDFSSTLYPAIEYNIFPYSQSNRKQLRILYGAGANFFNYIDLTDYDKEEELVFGQRMIVAVEFREKWGSVSTSIDGSHYFHNIKLKRLELETSLSLRLVRGLSLRLWGGASLIHDQINLRKKIASPEDVLLSRRQLASQYRYWGSVGLSYSFGSIYNNVVNPRFGR